MSIYVWLEKVEVQGPKTPDPAAVRQKKVWQPIRTSDSARLERAIAREEWNAVVPIECGRYDVDLRRRMVKALYWDEPDKEVLRSSWFHGKGGKDAELQPYAEEDAEELESAFQRLRSGKERAPLLVPVNKGRHDVRFEAMQRESPESSGSWNPFAGAPEKRLSVSGSDYVEQEPQVAVDGSSVEPNTTAGHSETLFMATQESVDRSAASKDPPEPVWRGYSSVPDVVPLEEKDEEELLPSQVHCLVFVVHGIGQFHRQVQGSAARFCYDVARLRRNVVHHLRLLEEGGQPVSGRLELLPLEWYESIHLEVGIGKRLRQVTLPSVAQLRDFANFALADIMVYQEEEWQKRIQGEIQNKMDRLWRLFCQRNPTYTGQTAVIAHSLGSVIMFDLIQNLLPEHARGLLSSGAGPTAGSPSSGLAAAARLSSPAVVLSGHAEKAARAEAARRGTVAAEAPSLDAAAHSTAAAAARMTADAALSVTPRGGSSTPRTPRGGGRAVSVAAPESGEAGVALPGCPAPRCFFAIGSPLGMFLSIRLSQRKQHAPRMFQGLDVRWPAASVGRGWRFFNVFHPDDPIAYRIEPLLNSDYASMQPKLVPHEGGLRVHYQVRQWFSGFGSGGSSAGSGSPTSGVEEISSDVLVVDTAEDEEVSKFLDNQPARHSHSAAVDRLDWQIQQSALESMNETLSAIHSHFAYWECEDMVHFIVDSLCEVLGQVPA